MSSRLSRASAGALAGSIFLITAATAAGPPPPEVAKGHALAVVATGLTTPTSFAFGGGKVFAGDAGSEDGKSKGGVFLLHNAKATRLPGSPQAVLGLTYRRGTLYVSSFDPPAKTRILAWSGWNGSRFTNRRVLVVPPKRFPGFNGLAFGANGRLYTGVSLEGNNDANPSNAPYAFDVISFNAAGKDLRVVARGLRQPWQLVFPRGSSSPFVSDLGQETKAKRPPDFIVRVRPGQNYGFPACNWTKPGACSGHPRPFRFFAPHTDPMGLAIVGSRLYFSSFTGLNAKGRGQIASIPRSGRGTPKVLLTSRVAPIVGLGEHGGLLYVGELTGTVYSVKP